MYQTMMFYVDGAESAKEVGRALLDQLHAFQSRQHHEKNVRLDVTHAHTSHAFNTRAKNFSGILTITYRVIPDGYVPA